MTAIELTGPWPPLRGAVAIPGAKNSAMPALVAAALAPGRVEVRGIPDCADLTRLTEILRGLGAEVELGGGVATVGPSRTARTDIAPEASAALRGSVYALALPAVMAGSGRCGPIGGDRLRSPSGRRSALTPHARAFAGLGMRLRPDAGGWRLDGGPPRAGTFSVDDDGVSASALAAILAAAADGTSLIHGASYEIEVDDTLACLRALGVRAERQGTTLVVSGPFPHRDAVVEVPPDRIDAGTIAVAAAVTCGAVELPGELAPRMEAVFAALRAFGVEVTQTDRVRIEGGATRPATLATAMYPGLPTDLLPPLTVLAATAPGSSVLEEGVYVSRDGHVPGLRALGAQIDVVGRKLIVAGPTTWRQATVHGDGIRETAALVLAGLRAPATRIESAGSLYRAYGDLVGTLSSLREEASTVAS